MRTIRLTTLWVGIALLVALVSDVGMGRQGARAGGSPASPLPRTLPIVGVSAIAVDALTDHVFAVASPGGPTSVYMFDGHSGAILRRTPLASQFAGSLAVDSATGCVFVAAPRPARLFILDAHTGALRRTVPLALIPAALAVDEQTGRVFVAEGNRDTDRVDVRDARDGALLRTVPVGKRSLALAVSASTDRVFVANMDSGSVSVLDARDGTPLRTVRVGSGPLFVAVDPGVGRAVVGSEYGAPAILDARSGALVRAIGPGVISAQLGVDRRTHRVFQINLTDSGGGISVYDAHSGRPLHATPLGLGASPFTTPVLNAATGHMLVLVVNVGARGQAVGAVLALDGLTGAVRASAPLGQTFAANTNTNTQVAVDMHTQRVFVSTTNALVVLDAARL